MVSPNHQGNKLFLVCPFCQMENFIIKRYGEAFFYTAPAAMFHFKNDNLQAIKEFITREEVGEIYLVGETSCNFTNNVLDNKDLSGLQCETEIQKLISIGDTPQSLTEKMMKNQANRLGGKALFGKEIEAGNTSLHILVTDKRENKITEIEPA
jgi:hypothetical protein